MLTVAANHTRNVLICGGAGFIGANLAAHLLATTDARVTLFDNLSGPGSFDNVRWLRALAEAGRLRFLRGDIRSLIRVTEAARSADEIYHCAARCTIATASDLRADFAVSATGTANVLEAARRSNRQPIVVFASTSKVYATPDDLELIPTEDRYEPVNSTFRGVTEDKPLDLNSSCAWAKAWAERYVRQYALEYRLPAVTFRLGSVAGPRQFPAGPERWVARLVNSALSTNSASIHGDGREVRDVLHVSDLVDAFTAARAYIGVTAGKVYNIGGGINRSVSIAEMVRLIQRTSHRAVNLHHLPDHGNHRVFDVSDCSSFSSDTGWMPRRTVEQTVRDVIASWHACHMPMVHPPAQQSRHFRRAA
jgi:CDP-paratose 2-epimerase